jgi:hypothetical protein
MKTRAIIIVRTLLSQAGFFLITALCVHAACGETIVLKSHKIIEAPILRKTYTYIIIDNNGLQEKYDLSDIETIIDNRVGYGQVSYPSLSPAAKDSQSKTGIFFYGNDLDSNDNSHALMTNFKEFNKAEEMIKDVKENFDQHFLNK